MKEKRITRTYGPDFVESRDGERLRAQRERIRNYMLAASIRNEWLTLEQISAGLDMAYEGTNFQPASVSAQLRHLRHPEHGGYTLVKRYVERGLWEYRLYAPVKGQAPLLEIPLQHYRETLR
jgi:hypothetical protein